MTTNTLDSSIVGMEARISQLEKILNRCDTMLVPENKQNMINELSRKERMLRSLHQMRERYDVNNDALAWDDVIVKDTLYMCKGKEYEFNFRSKDVIHSAYFPHFRAQMNTVPGMTTRFKFVPDKTTEDMRAERNDENFNFILMCNKICGGAHYKMKMMVVVLEEKEYNAWWDTKKNLTFKDTYFAKSAASEDEADDVKNGDQEGENEEGEEEEGADVAEAPEQDPEV
jgi:cytochrome c oxidase subunit 2